MIFGSAGSNSGYIGTCDIHNPTGGNPGYMYSGIYSNSATNTITLQDNNISNWLSYGIYMNNAASGCSISGNNLFETTTQTGTLYGIYINGGSGHTITNNNFGGSAIGRTGMATSSALGVYGIYLNVGTSSATSIQGNQLSNFGSTGTSSNSAVYGVYVAGGNVNIGTVTGNTFGGGALPSDTIRNGYDNGIIYSQSPGIVDIENNTIGNISYYGAANVRTAGIMVISGTVTIKNNTVRDIKGNSTGTGMAYLPVGIFVNSNGSLSNPVIEKNTITNIWNINTGTNAFTAAGIDVQTPNVSNITIRNNKITNVAASGTGTGSNAPVVYGIFNSGVNTNIINNMISLGQGPPAAESRIYGVFDASSGTNTYCFNSIAISGTASGSNSTYAFYSGNNGSATAKNNIFHNSRSGGSIKPCAIGTGNGINLTSNYNDLYSTGTPLGTWGATSCNDLSAWKTASSQDANSISANPIFLSITDLHISSSSGSPVNNAGINIAGITADCDYLARNNPPDIGACEITAIPVVNTLAATDVAFNGATLNGNANAVNTTFNLFFDWGLTTSYGNTVAATPAQVTGFSFSNISTGVSGLTASTTYHFRVRGVTTGGLTINGTDMTFTTPSPPTRTLNLKVMLEGIYAGAGTMYQAQDENGPHYGAGIADKVTVELHNSANYSAIVYSTGPVNLSTSGDVALTTIPSEFSGSYYITVRHRNSLETTTATPVSMAGSTTTYNFSTSATKAFGNNQKDAGDGYFVLWGGDVNQDGIVDSSDIGYVDNSSTAIVLGYVPEDVNGDGIVDSTDIGIVDNNSTTIVYTQTP